MQITIKKAAPQDLKIALSIMREAKEWTERNGEIMWSEQDISEEVIGNLINESVLYFALVDDEHVSTCTYQTTDPIYWPEITDDSTAFVHRLAVKRQFSGRGLGEVMVNWAKKRAQSEGKRFLRLDCTASRASLCRYYQSLGFIKKEVRWIE